MTILKITRASKTTQSLVLRRYLRSQKVFTPLYTNHHMLKSKGARDTLITVSNLKISKISSLQKKLQKLIHKDRSSLKCKHSIKMIKTNSKKISRSSMMNSIKWRSKTRMEWNLTP